MRGPKTINLFYSITQLSISFLNNFIKQFKTKKMKRIISLLSTVTMISVLTIALSLSSCKKESPLNSDKISDEVTLSSSERSGAPLKVDVVPIDMDVKFMDNKVFNLAGGAPVNAPDGHQVTMAEFHMVSGWADVKCINEGTHVVLHLKGLIPNGVYTLWVMTFSAPGVLSGIGALGAPDGSQNILNVNSKGTANLSVTMPGGNLSLFGAPIPNCWRTVYQVMIAGDYHLDGQTHGGSPGSHETGVLQFGFPVMGSKL